MKIATRDKIDMASIVDSALGVLGESNKRNLYHYLEKNYNIRIKPGEPIVPIKQLEQAFADLLGQGGAEVILDMINRQYQKIRVTT
ncbi:hypothetical protein [Candidatus Nitrososphaera gargensis]|nr:hypothetical protein [Candidatus Nitrososphaera gargensis]